MDEINWRTVVAARYGDGPGDDRVGNVLKSLPGKIRCRIAVAFDYKGILQVVWTREPSEEQRRRVGTMWQEVGGESSDNVSHYALSTVESSGCAIWDDQVAADELPKTLEEASEQHQQEFRREIAAVINKFSAENGSDTPDFILAEYLIGALELFDATTKDREKWYGREPVPVPPDQAPPRPDVVGKPFLSSI